MAKKSVKNNNKIVKVLGRRTKRGVSGIKGIIMSIISLPKNIFNFLKSVRQELKLVDWLSRKKTAKWSSAVIFTALALGGFLVLADLIFFKLRDLLFKI
ncbi:MAG: hypothetical protein US52_C0020G0008 [candidate division WS6 bacterium GW2011_GWA2_37_6]|uniref:Protein translocase subunit SecE n=1 Tax=candidate division WS6 bacterium GW2011_GWA2_37_6 TaxID=1619087 RepID=A0A0G0K4T3_9BACT|nr:MAG: hypothetical protein US52_C0020G0008 [candidate division WS6 bacterium GW2011_GWA2_37_6]